MTEIIEPGVLHHKPRRRIKPLDVIIFIVVLALLVFLGTRLFGMLSLKNEVSAAQKVSDTAIAAIDKNDSNALRSLGDSGFKSKNSANSLKANFAPVSEVISGNGAITRKTVDKSGTNDTVYLIYKFNAKTPIYIRTGMQESAGRWQLANISVNSDESKLITR